MEVAERGRLRPEVVEAYERAHRGTRARKATVAKPRAVKPVVVAKTAPVRPAGSPAAAAPEVEVAEHPTTLARLQDLENQIAALAARVTQLEQASPEPASRRGLRRR